MLTATRPRTTRLLEREQGNPSRVDRSTGIIRGVRIIGRQSKNGREYTDAALNDAARLYEGCRVLDNHPSRSDAHRERGFGELVGTLRNVRREGDAVRGDLHLITSGPLASRIMEAAESIPHVFGLSHNAEGKTSRRGGKTVVESVVSVRSVDIVLQPATNESLFESYGTQTATELVNSVETLVQDAATMIGTDPKVNPKRTAQRVDIIQQAAGVFVKALRAGLKEKLEAEESAEAEAEQRETHSVSSDEVSESYDRRWRLAVAGARGLKESRQQQQKPKSDFDRRWQAALSRCK